MSLVHKQLGSAGEDALPIKGARAPFESGPAPAAPPPAPTPDPKPTPASTPAPKTAVDSLTQFLEQTRLKEQQLKEGIARLRDTVQTLRQRLEEAEQARHQGQKDHEEALRLAAEREAQMNATIAGLKQKLSDADATATRERQQRRRDPESASPPLPAPPGRGSLIAQAKARA